MYFSLISYHVLFLCMQLGGFFRKGMITHVKVHDCICSKGEFILSFIGIPIVRGMETLLISAVNQSVASSAKFYKSFFF